MQQVMNMVQIVIATILVTVILVQVKGQGTGLFGSSDGSYRTRRGIEKLLFQFTIVLIAVFIVTSIISVRVF
jgi:preprotein translocase subunit SecG